MFLLQLSDELWHYVSGLFFFVGFISNFLTVVTMCQKNTRRLNISVHLIVLAINDNMLLTFILLPKFLHRFVLIKFTDTLAGCKLKAWLLPVLEQYSTWIIVIMTVERFVSIYYPIVTLSKTSWFVTPLKLTGVAVFFMIVNGHQLYGFMLFPILGPDNSTQSYYCSYSKEKAYYEFSAQYWPWIRLFFSSFLPFTVLLLCNTAIVYKVKTGSRHLTEGQNKSKDRKSKRKTVSIKLITLLNSVFLVSSLPFPLFTISYRFVAIPGDQEQHAQLYLLYTVANLLIYINNTFNFFLYLISGRLIREEFLRVFCGQSKMKRRPAKIAAVSR